MPIPIRHLIAIASLAMFPAIECARAQSPVVIHELTAPDAKSTDHFGTILGVRPLADGKLLVNDGQRRQLVILDAQLGNRVVAIDSASVGGQSYGAYPAPIIPYLSDSTLFVDVTSLSLVVLSPNGSFVRVMAAPKPADLRLLGSRASGVDAKGNLIYQGGAMPAIKRSTDGNHITITPRDSAPIVRANFETRSVDTIGRVKIATGARLHTDTENGRTVNSWTFSPLSAVDDWAVLIDGTVLILRGHDYHADVLARDGGEHAAPKLAFDWKQLTDRDKQLLVDSMTDVFAKRAAVRDAPPAKTSNADSPPPPPVGFTVVGIPPASSGAVASYSIVDEVVPVKEIPDYWPPMRVNAAKADLDGNVWILPTTSAQAKNGELVYDVVNNRGEMLERVRIPSGKSIAGFGKNGVVYLMVRDADGWGIERVRIAKKPD